MTNENLPPRIHVLAKPTGATCNLNCSYCFFLNKELLYPGSSFRMSDAVLENYIRQLIESHRANTVTVAWQGGEPTLMGLDFYRRAIEYQNIYQRPGMTFENTLQTNGTLLNEEWCEFFRDHGFLIGISIDGPRELHDAHRVDKGGRPTFDRVMKGLRLLQKHRVDYNILTTVNRLNADHPFEVYRFLRDEAGATWMQFIPAIERLNEEGVSLCQEGTTVSDRSVRPEQLGNFLITIFDEWVRNDVGRVFVQTFEATVRNWLGLPSSGMCVFDATCGHGLALEHNGDLYSCDHFVVPKHLLGNIRQNHMMELVSSDQQLTFRVPAMMRWPGKIKPGTVSNEIVSHLDWLPTFLAAAGEPNIKEKLLQGHQAGAKTFKVHLDGYNLLPFLKGEVKKSPRVEYFYFSDDGDLMALRYDNWKLVFMEQRMVGTLLIWQEPLVPLRFPKLFNLRTDPFERADITSNTYWDWIIDHIYLFLPAQKFVGEFLMTFKEFPPRQKAASFTIDQVLQKLLGAAVATDVAAKQENHASADPQISVDLRRQFAPGNKQN